MVTICNRCWYRLKTYVWSSKRGKRKGVNHKSQFMTALAEIERERERDSILSLSIHPFIYGSIHLSIYLIFKNQISVVQSSVPELSSPIACLTAPEPPASFPLLSSTHCIPYPSSHLSLNGTCCGALPWSPQPSSQYHHTSCTFLSKVPATIAIQ